MNYWWQQLKKHPTRLLVGGFAAAILAGGLLLTLRVSASGPRIGFLDALFTATSAVCVTVQEILPHVTKAAVADVSDRPALEELGIADFDLVAVCVGERLETAVLLVHHLHQLQVPRILVKVVNAEQAEIVKLVGATEVIQPEQSAARKAALLTHHPRTIDFLELGGGQLVIAGHAPSSVVGKTVGALALQERFGVALLAVWRTDQEGPPSPPEPTHPIADTDILILAGHIDRLRELRRMK